MASGVGTNACRRSAGTALPALAEQPRPLRSVLCFGSVLCFRPNTAADIPSLAPIPLRRNADGPLTTLGRQQRLKAWLGVRELRWVGELVSLRAARRELLHPSDSKAPPTNADCAPPWSRQASCRHGARVRRRLRFRIFFSRCPQVSTAIASISTLAPLGNAATCTQALAGDTPSPKTSA